MPYQNIAIFADTPIQIFFTLVFSEHYSMRSRTDVYIIDEFSGSRRSMEALKHSGLFRNVYYIEKDKSKRLSLKVRKVLGLINPGSYAVNHLNCDIGEKKYDAIFLSSSSYIKTVLTFASKGSTVMAYEDGIGSYFYDLFLYAGERDYLRFTQLFHRKIQIKTMYLTSPMFYSGPDDKKIFPLGNIAGLAESYREEIRNVFRSISDGEQKSYRPYTYIYFNQPIDRVVEILGEEVLRKEKQILDAIDHCRLIVRLHPRENRTDFYNDIETDRTGYCWEMVCERDIDESKYLIGHFSTAQFTPKLLYNKEPYLLFLFEMFDVNEDNRTEHRRCVEQSKKMYSDPTKIACPQSVDELKGFLNMARRERTTGLVKRADTTD